MLLIIILILSQDKGFSQNMQEVMLGSVPWYKERMLQKTSLGDLSQFIFLLQLAAAYMFNYAFQSPMLSVCHNPRKPSIWPSYLGNLQPACYLPNKACSCIT